MKHTSGIWKIVKGTEDNGGGAYAINSEPIIDGLEWNLATIWNAGDLDGVTAQANAERIVKCVNGWDELENIKESLENDKFTIIDEFDSLQEEATKLRKALEGCLKYMEHHKRDTVGSNDFELVAFKEAKQALK